MLNIDQNIIDAGLLFLLYTLLIILYERIAKRAYLSQNIQHELYKDIEINYIEQDELLLLSSKKQRKL